MRVAHADGVLSRDEVEVIRSICGELVGQTIEPEDAHLRLRALLFR